MLAARARGVFHPLPETRLLEIGGADAARYLNAMATRDLGGLGPGGARYAALCDDRGRYLADFWVWRPAERWVLECAATVADDLAGWLATFAVADDVEVRDTRDRWALFHVEGPGAEAALRELGVEPEDREEIPVRELEITLESGRKTVWAARRSRYGEEGWTLVIERDAAEALAAGLTARASAAGLVEAPPAARETLRVEAGRPLGGVDVTERDLLQEAGLLEAISLDKGCYPGQEILQRVARAGRVRRRLLGVRFPREAAGADPDESGLAGADLLGPESEAAGHLTSAAFSPELDAVVALAWLAGPLAEPGADVYLRSRSGPPDLLFAGRVQALPFVSGTLGPLPETPRLSPEDRIAR